MHQTEAPVSKFCASASGFPSFSIAASAVSKQVSNMADVALRRDFTKLARFLSLKDKVSCLAHLKLFNKML